jgi:hypothetical protein
VKFIIADGWPRSGFSDRGILEPQPGLQIIILRWRTIEIEGEAMRNLTVSIRNETYLEARIWALRRGTSVSALVERFLATLNENDTPGLAFSDGGLEAGLDSLDGPPSPLFTVEL